MSKIFNNLQQFYKRISPGVAGVVAFGAGYAMSDTFTEAPRGQMTASQRSEWERLLNETARRRRLNRLRKSTISDTSLLKRVFSKSFYWLISQLSNITVPASASDFRLVSRRVMNHLIAYNTNSPFLRGMVAQLGFKSFILEFRPHNRGMTRFVMYTKRVISRSVIWKFF